VVVEGLRPLQARYADLTRDPGTLDAILRQGAEFCAAIANQTLLDTQRAMGIR
jgi:tryptophanyl-tRNA synthetase